jgi:CheY-like chemotaxis protein
MKEAPKPVQILIVDDDADDRLLIREAFDENALACRLEFVENGEGMLRLLSSRLSGKGPRGPGLPDLILLDLNMPKMDGREALDWIKKQAKLKHIPVVVLTTSNANEDIQKTYDLGGSSFVVKPSSFDELVGTVGAIWNYWCGIVKLPERGSEDARIENVSAGGDVITND